MSEREPETGPTAGTPGAGVFDATVSDGVCRLRRPDTRFLSTGFDGGETVADAAYNVTVPEGWPEQPLRPYVDERLADAGFAAGADASTDAPPVLLTGVDQRHAHRARHGPVEVVATAGLSNPAQLAVGGGEGESHEGDPVDGVATASTPGAGDDPVGTVNLILGTTHSLASGALPNLVAVAAAAKATTLLATTGFPGTTSDAVVVGCDPTGERSSFSGAATAVGKATRICVRDAVAAAVESRYGDGTDASLPDTVAAADHGVVTAERATAVEPVAIDDAE